MQSHVMLLLMLLLMLMMMSDGLNSFLGPRVLTAAAPVYTPGPDRGLETPARKSDRRKQTIEEDQRPSNEQLTTYLERFGYLQRRNRSRYGHSDRDIKSAIRHLQRFGLINETGSWNRETAELVRRPRCGLPDEPSVEGDRGSSRGRRRRRYTMTGGKWPKNELKYRILAYSSKVRPGLFQSTLQSAFDRWSDVIPLTFTQTFNWLEADIEVAFARLDHGDGYPFDGPGGVLSHTFSPSDGRMHLDDDETWAIGYSDDSIDLRQVVLHEIGHLVGLGHSNYPGALMNPYYPGYHQDIQLTQDDISGAQELYGVPSGYVPPEDDEPSSSSTTTTSSSSSTVTTTTAEESSTSITSSTTTSSSSSPVVAAAVMTPKLEPRLTPVGLTPRAPVRVTPRRN